MEKKLSDFLPNLGDATAIGSLEISVSGLEFDSRRVTQGFLFAAFDGLHTDGHQFIPMAVEKGASVILHSKEIPPEPGITYLKVTDVRRAFSRLAAAFYDHPSSAIPVIGVTGTDGKSSTVSFIHQLLSLGGKKAGFLSTVAFQTGSETAPNALRQSTPEANQIHALLREMIQNGLEYAVLESTSHGLSAKTCRLEDVFYSTSVFTNVTTEHLEFHGTVEQYRSDKSRLFGFLDKGGAPQESFGVVNADDPHHGLFIQATKRKVYTYSLKDPQADLYAQIISSTPSGTKSEFHFQGQTRLVDIGIPGAFNVENIMAALLAVAPHLGRSPLDLLDLVESLRGIPGRMNPIDEGQDFHVLVDYAHTPGSFEKIFPMVRETTPGRLIAVFGSAGERDREKRPLQGALASRWSDLIILTDEDPRLEQPMDILEEIAQGVEGKVREKSLFLIPNRRKAISKAFHMAKKGDTVILLGKGHEKTIEYAQGPLDWSDERTAREELKNLLGTTE